MPDEAVQGLRELERRLVLMAKRARNRRAAMKESAELMVASVRQNFDAGGRPSRWKPHAASTRRRLVGPQRVLVRKGRLRDSFRPKATNDEAAAASNVIYGPRHHFGYPGGRGRGRSRTPARPVAMLQASDVAAIGGRIFARHIFGR
jgi:phage virion morphogenesis protein